MPKKNFTKEGLKITNVDITLALANGAYIATDITDIVFDKSRNPFHVVLSPVESNIVNGKKLDFTEIWYDWSELQTAWRDLNGVNQFDVEVTYDPDNLTTTINWGFEEDV